jgi:predicted transcriptional regulator
MSSNTGLGPEARRRILDHVRAHPGVRLGALADALGMPESTLAYHCRVLDRRGEVALRDVGGLRAYYPMQGMDRRDRDLLHVVLREAPRQICLHLLVHPGSTPSELSRALEVSGSALSFHLGRLRAANVLVEEPQGRTKRLYIRDAQRVAHVLTVHPCLPPGAPDAPVEVGDGAS